jgi:hypothetical protein
LNDRRHQVSKPEALALHAKLGVFFRTDLAIQWDTAAEICFILESPEIPKVISTEVPVAAIARVREHVPAEAELGAAPVLRRSRPQSCRGAKDTKLMVDFTNQLVAAIKHPIAWVHMPIPREREDVAYFAPLNA